MGIRRVLSGDAEHGLAVHRRLQHVAILEGRLERHRGDRQDDADAGVDRPRLRHEQIQIGDDLVDLEVDRLEQGRIEGAAGHAGGRGIDGARGDRPPCFRQPQGEDQHVGFLEHPPHRGQMFGARRPQRVQIGEALRVDLRPKGVHQPVVPLPRLVERRVTEGPIEQLNRLANRVDVAIAGGEDAVVRRLGLGRRQGRGRRFRHEIVEAGGLQPTRDVLGEAAAHRRHLVGGGNHERRPGHRVHLGRMHPGDAPAPEAVIGKRAVGIAHQAAISRSMDLNCGVSAMAQVTGPSAASRARNCASR